MKLRTRLIKSGVCCPGEGSGGNSGLIFRLLRKNLVCILGGWLCNTLKTSVSGIECV